MKMADVIPFNRARCEGRELRYVGEAVENGLISGDGRFTQRCQALLREVLGSEKVLLTTSCTHALEMMALLLEVGPGDEVIVPSFTFVSTANAFVRQGAVPVFADVREDTLNLDESLLEGLVTPRTKAIVPVHYAGVGCELEPILTLAARRGVAVVEDNAHGLLGTYRGKPLGAYGCMSALSFHESKNFSCGEGGALAINDPRYAERAEVIREKGTNRSHFFRGQLEARDRIQTERRRVWDHYAACLTPWAEQHGVRIPFIPEHCTQTYHMFYLIMPSHEDRQGLIRHLRSRRVQSVFHYLPLHRSKMGERFGGRERQCPVTEEMSARLVRLPLFTGLTESDLERVVDGVLGYYD
jgi:dTDP-4-amino-4,6-dideoxygalactose transaminase